MRIAIVNVQAPFVRGGAEYLADSLGARLRGRGHAVELVKIPFKPSSAEAVTDHILACRLMRLDPDLVDLVIALKFPAYLIPFENKRVWLLHQFRQVYDLWGTEFASFPDRPEGRGLQSMVERVDRESLSSVKKLYSNSKIVADRLRRYNAINVDEVLYPPLDHPELYREGDSQPYFFYPSRLNASKRQHVAIEAMRHVRSDVKLVIAGRADSDEYGRQLREQVEKGNLKDRVRFLGWVDETEKARWMSNALGAVYLPFDEDSYGYVTLEAFHSHKPLLTFSDSGGTGELMEDGRNGHIVAPEAERLAEAMDRMASNRVRTREMGHEAFATLSRHRIEWDAVLDRLAA